MSYDRAYVVPREIFLNHAYKTIGESAYSSVLSAEASICEKCKAKCATECQEIQYAVPKEAIK